MGLTVFNEKPVTWTLEGGTLTVSGKGVFQWDKSLTEHKAKITKVIIQDGITSITHGALSGFTNLESIVIPDSVTKIGTNAFLGCTKLKVIKIPDGVTKIGPRAFYNCTNLTEINYSGTSEQWNAISKSSSWAYRTGNYTINYNSK